MPVLIYRTRGALRLSEVDCLGHREYLDDVNCMYTWLDYYIALQVEFKLSLNTEIGGFNLFSF
jgi:hypothetical protein